MREKFVFGFVFRLYLEFFWLTFFRSRTGYGDLQSESAYSVQIREKCKAEELLIRTLFYAVSSLSEIIASEMTHSKFWSYQTNK